MDWQHRWPGVRRCKEILIKLKPCHSPGPAQQPPLATSCSEPLQSLYRAFTEPLQSLTTALVQLSSHYSQPPAQSQHRMQGVFSASLISKAKEGLFKHLEYVDSWLWNFSSITPDHLLSLLFVLWSSQEMMKNNFSVISARVPGFQHFITFYTDEEKEEKIFSAFSFSFERSKVKVSFLQRSSLALQHAQTVVCFVKWK